MVNIPFLAAALLLTAAFFAHLIVGTRETLSLQTDGKKTGAIGCRLYACSNWLASTYS